MTTSIASPLDWDVEAVARFIEGSAFGDRRTPIASVVTDSRQAQEGSLFVALEGEQTDGHEFVDVALETAAAAVVGRDRVAGEPRIEVDRPLDALLALAVQRRSELSSKVVAVTGSTGKTSTKDMLQAVLGRGTWASPKSFNNDVGVPLTVLGAPGDAPYLVAEVGSRGKGHIARLVPAVRPDVAVITNVGIVHLETFGSTEGIVEGKWELIDALDDDGTAVLPTGDERLQRPHLGTTITFGEEAHADVRVTAVSIDDRGNASFSLETPAGTADIHLAMAGDKQPLNAAAAAATAVSLGFGIEEIATGLATATGSDWRMDYRSGAFAVVNDAYNANPDSMEAALRTVAAMPGRKLAVLGLMAELGALSKEEHLRIGQLARRLGFYKVIVAGEDHGIAEGAGDIAIPVDGPAQATEVAKTIALDGDVILVKASRAAALETVAFELAGETPT